MSESSAALPLKSVSSFLELLCNRLQLLCWKETFLIYEAICNGILGSQVRCGHQFVVMILLCLLSQQALGSVIVPRLGRSTEILKGERGISHPHSLLQVLLHKAGNGEVCKKKKLPDPIGRNQFWKKNCFFFSSNSQKKTKTTSLDYFKQ